jgi:NTP pyrophosphatase (non-canonical NTP hydrolase)
MNSTQEQPAQAGQVERLVSQHFNGLTPAEAERLALLAEECGEVIQAIGKVLRHGYESRHPNGGPTNREALEKEIGDVHHATIRMGNAGDISGNAVLRHADDKEKNVAKYLHHDG